MGLFSFLPEGMVQSLDAAGRISGLQWPWVLGAHVCGAADGALLVETLFLLPAQGRFQKRPDPLPGPLAPKAAPRPREQSQLPGQERREEGQPCHK